MPRKITGVILSIVMLTACFVFAPVSLADGDSQYQIVRIKLSMGAPTTVPFYLDGNYSVAQDETVVLPRQAYTVTLKSGKLYLKYGNTVLYSGTDIRLVQHAPTDGLNNFIRLKNAEYGYRNYLGDLRFIIYDGYIRVINHIYLDDYLYGVVPYEMSNSWPIEALKSQAVCARTYAVRYMDGNGTYDLVDTPVHQAYKGYNPSNTNAFAAVDQTAKTTLMCGSSFVQTFYSASNGGYTEIPQHVWSATSTLYPYHIMQLDPYDTANPYSSQELLIFPKMVSNSTPITYQYSSSGTMKTGTGSEAANAERYLKASCLPAVAKKGYIAGVTGDVQVVSIDDFVPHTLEEQHDILDYSGNNLSVMYENADVTMTVLAYRYADGSSPGGGSGDVDGDGEITISDYTLVRLHILGLKTLDESGIAKADVNGDGDITISDYTLVRLHILNLKKIGESGSSSALVQEPVTVTFTIDMHEFDDSDGRYCAFTRSLRLFVVKETDTAFKLYHRRYGHGIGLSQRGAQQRANDGQTYQNILSFYYPNTTYDVLDISAPSLSAIDDALSSANATVTAPECLNVRSSPDSSSSGNIVGNLPTGARIEVTEAFATDNWHAINYGNTTAYVHKDYVTLD